MPVEPNLDTFQWLFIRGSQRLDSRDWETSEQSWVWCVRFLAWKYLVQLNEEEWTWTEDSHTLPKTDLARQLRHAAICLLQGRQAIHIRRNPDFPWQLEMKASPRNRPGRTLEKLWNWLSESFLDFTPSPRPGP